MKKPKGLNDYILLQTKETVSYMWVLLKEEESFFASLGENSQVFGEHLRGILQQTKDAV